MRRNITSIERSLRLVVGLTILGFALGLYPRFSPWLGLVALIPLGTAMLGYCPLYQLLGYDGCKRPAG